MQPQGRHESIEAPSKSCGLWLNKCRACLKEKKCLENGKELVQVKNIHFVVVFCFVVVFLFCCLLSWLLLTSEEFIFEAMVETRKGE